MERFPLMVTGISSDDTALQLQAAFEFRQLLSKNNPPIDQVIATGFVPRFLEFLDRDDLPQLQCDSITVLTNIAYGISKNAGVVFGHEAIPIFVKLLYSPTTDFIREQVVWLLGKVTADSPLLRDLACRHGGLTSLISLLNVHPRLSMLQIASWTLSKFCIAANIEQTKLALPALECLIRSTDEIVLAHVFRAFGYICDGTDEKTQAVIETKVWQRLLELFSHPSPLVIRRALWVFNNIVCGDERQTQCIINQALPYLLNMIKQNQSDSILKEACLAVSNITGGNEENTQAVIAAGIIGPLVHLLQTAEFDIKKEAAIAIANAIYNGSSQQIKYLVAQGCIRGICDMLLSPDPEIVRICLEGLEIILKVGP